MRKYILLAGSILITIASSAQGEINFDGTECKDKVQYRDFVIKDQIVTVPIVLFCSEFALESNFNRAVIKEDLDMRIVTFESELVADNVNFAKTANFYKSTFKENSRFNHSMFYGLADFRKSVFEKNANFQMVESLDELNFHSSRFKANAEFQNGHYYKDTNFSGVFFEGDVNFKDSRFDTYGIYLASQFNMAVNFSYISFKENVAFDKSNFLKQANFSNTEFGGKAHFKNVDFEGIADFSNSEFSQFANFYNTRFKDEFRIEGTILPDTLQFNYVTEVAKTIDFSKARLRGRNRCIIDLVETDLSNIKLDYTDFELYFAYPEEYTYEQMDNTYKNLLAHQEEHGFNKGYKRLKKDYNKWKGVEESILSDDNMVLARNIGIGIIILLVGLWVFLKKRKPARVA
jgi:hypothetical protein